MFPGIPWTRRTGHAQTKLPLFRPSPLGQDQSQTKETSFVGPNGWPYANIVGSRIIKRREELDFVSCFLSVRRRLLKKNVSHGFFTPPQSFKSFMAPPPSLCIPGGEADRPGVCDVGWERERSAVLAFVEEKVKMGKSGAMQD